jgi:hypothetical protein
VRGGKKRKKEKRKKTFFRDVGSERVNCPGQRRKSVSHFLLQKDTLARAKEKKKKKKKEKKEKRNVMRTKNKNLKELSGQASRKKIHHL